MPPEKCRISDSSVGNRIFPGDCGEGGLIPLFALGSQLRLRERWALVGLLAVLHLALFAGGAGSVGLAFWLVDVGLFILWQPLFRTERRLDAGGLVAFALIVGSGAWLFGWWLLIFWVAVLAALVGGRVMFVDHRPTRVFHLLAFAYLLLVLLVWLVPRVVPGSGGGMPSFETELGWGAPLLFLAMLLLPERRGAPRPHSGVVDFFYSLFIFLLVAVLVLGSLAFMLLRQSPYIEAVAYTLLAMAGMLLLLGWAWNPRPGFAGVGVFFSRYLLTIGLPVEEWLHRLTLLAEQESDPERFAQEALESMLELPWVEGGAWGGDGMRHVFGRGAAHFQDFPEPPLHLRLHTRYKLSPVLVWHFRLLSRLISEYYVAKLRARELQQMSYLRAVHETGARLTHDVKNLLQSLNNLCYLAQEDAGRDPASVQQLLQRQLPQITLRLRQTLEKLQKPGGETGVRLAVGTWWVVLQQRYAQDAVRFATLSPLPGAELPAMLFDSVADNLLQNALAKLRLEMPPGGMGEPAVEVSLAADGSWLKVCDRGSPVPGEVLRDLLRAPVASESGFGIGLFHAARLAVEHGYRLHLLDNRPGGVCFELRREGAVPGP